MQYPVIVHDVPVEPMLEYRIRVRAYDLFLERGGADGHALDDWLKAEVEITHGGQFFFRGALIRRS
jgi:Protein of unknown function (DUF2934)